MDKGKVAQKLEEFSLISILVAIFVAVFTLVVFVFYQRKRASRNCILVTGLCNSGKTLLFSQLLYKKFVQTHTSIKENIGAYVANNNRVKIVDIPGHERLRDKFVEQYKELTRGVVFVVDSLTIQQDIQDVAEFLYNILADGVFSKNNPQVVILCNKQDQTLSKGANAIKAMLEKELNTLRLTKSSQLDSVDPKARRSKILGDDDKEFTFASLNYKIDFAESCAFNKSGSIDIDELSNWLLKVA